VELGVYEVYMIVHTKLYRWIFQNFEIKSTYYSMKQKNSVNIIDLSKKTPDEIAEFLLALQAAKRTLLKKGFVVKISRKRKPNLKLL
jgi:hypothetical protein